MRLALAAAVLAFTAAAHGSPHAYASPHANASPHAKATPHVKPAPDRDVRAVIDAGNAQTAWAYAEPAKSQYVTEFPKLLQVRIPAWPREDPERRVRFACVTRGCTFAAVDQPNDGKYVDHVHPSVYDAHLTKGTAFVKIAIDGDRPAAIYTVTATPRTKPGERAVPATFTLTSR